MRPSRFLSAITTPSAPRPQPEPETSRYSQQDPRIHTSSTIFNYDIDSPALRPSDANAYSSPSAMTDEKTPLLADQQIQHTNNTIPGRQQRHAWPKRIASGFIGAFKFIITTLFAPGYYLIACFYDEDGTFSAAMPIHRLSRTLSPKKKRRKKEPAAVSTVAASDEKRRGSLHSRGGDSADGFEFEGDSPAKHTRSQSSSSSASDENDDVATRPKRSIRIKALSEDTLRKRNRHHLDASESSAASIAQPPLTVDTIKSPISPTAMRKDTRWPRAPAPPRPLIPKRQPSFSNLPLALSGAPRKTLIIDLDETLIHSMAKGGRMSTGHMVEVRLQTPVGMGGTVIGPQVPILYYVHKRPYCDEFLRKVSRWYNLIIFTASVQEYADPVIDWLELERKYFSARYYRQHCTYRNGAFIKDLSHVEPDLSRVMILDNSPMSYIFHEDNAIPIEGWISDPTDNDLQHLVPLLEGLQHATDVRALLALRLGESSQPS